MSQRNSHRHWPRPMATEQRAAFSRQPRRTLAIATVALVLTWLGLTWLVLAKSLSYAVAETSPEFALWLNPSQPHALLTLAERARAKLLKSIAADTEVTSSVDDAKEPADGDRASTRHGASREPQDTAMDRETLREEIRVLAGRVIANEPLEASAFRLLAEATSEPAKLRPLMEAAMQRSRRESNAVFWLMNDSMTRKSFPDVIEKADILLRTRPQVGSYVLGYLDEIARTPEGRALLIPVLAKNPPWRSAFLTTLPGHVRSAEAPLDVLLALKESGSPPLANELASYLNFLMSNKRPDVAYDTWLQFIPQQQLASIGLLNNAAFAQKPSGFPFDWSFQSGQNTVVDFVPLRDQGGSRALRLGFGVGRVRFPEPSQVLLLAPGRYRLVGVFQGLLTAKRGLRWEFRCLEANNLLSESEMIYGVIRGGRDFTLDVNVPDSEGCRAQRLRLYHHARSPSEELISGEILFRSLNLLRLDQLG